MPVSRRALVQSAAALPVLLAGGMPIAMEGTTLRLAHFLPKSSFADEVLWQVAESIRKDTEWFVNLEVYPAEVLGKGPELVYQLLYGGGPAQLVLLKPDQLQRIDGDLAALQLPGLFRSYAHWQSFRDEGVEEEVAARLSYSGLELIGSAWVASDHLFVPRSIERVEDLRGLKLRTPRITADALGGLRALGIEVVQIPAAEVLTALSYGVVDGTVLSLPWIDHAVLEAAERLQPLPLGGGVHWLVASRQAMDRLEAFERGALRRNLRDALITLSEQTEDEVRKWLDRAASYGVERTRLGEGDWQDSREAMIAAMMEELPAGAQKLAWSVRDVP